MSRAGCRSFRPVGPRGADFGTIWAEPDHGPDRRSRSRRRQWPRRGREAIGDATVHRRHREGVEVALASETEGSAVGLRPGGAAEYVEGDAIARDGVLQASLELVAERARAERAGQPRFGGLAGTELRVREAPQAWPACCVFGELHHEDLPALLDDGRDAVHAERLRPGGRLRQLGLTARRSGDAARPPGAALAARALGRADRGAELHQRLVEVAGPSARDQAFGEPPQLRPQRVLLGIAPEPEAPAEHPLDVAVDDGRAPPVRDARDGAGGVRPDARQRAERFDARGHLAGVVPRPPRAPRPAGASRASSSRAPARRAARRPDPRAPALRTSGKRRIQRW